ncbi:jg22047 [Pararge aegeria aegeria]|uniref:Jg22047 protein n=1 Tax=Pararge aegeria aegeria TaxID=348720 RepID=A0A8S4RGU8_9NEOP|nr:jg22047 [Pararge aegeria aegeria]
MMEKLAVKQLRLVNRYMPLLLQDKARPHTAQKTATKLEVLQLECLRYPPYSADLLKLKFISYFKIGKLLVGTNSLPIFFEIRMTSCKGKNSTPMGLSKAFTMPLWEIWLNGSF